MFYLKSCLESLIHCTEDYENKENEILKIGIEQALFILEKLRSLIDQLEKEPTRNKDQVEKFLSRF